MVVIPIDGDDDEAQDVGEEDRQQGIERAQVGAVWHSQLQHHDGDEDRDHSIAEGVESLTAH